MYDRHDTVTDGIVRPFWKGDDEVDTVTWDDGRDWDLYERLEFTTAQSQTDVMLTDIDFPSSDCHTGLSR